LHRQGSIGEAEPIYRRLRETQPDLTEPWHLSGVIELQKGNPSAAVPLLRQALARDDFVSLLNMARALERMNKLDEAEDCAAKALAQQPDLPAANLFTAKIDYRQKCHQLALDKLNRAIATSTETAVLTDAHYTAGLAYDALERPDEAFAAFTQANALEREQTLSDGVTPERYRARIQAAQERLQNAPTAPVETPDAAQPVFFVGFPRSGTTLLEQMLAAHPGVITSNEVSPLAEVARTILQGPPLHTLDAQALSAHRAQFWAATQSSVGDVEGRLLIDKMPLNIEFLDIAARLFPKAKVLMALRDPRDVCLSCFMQHFERTHALANFQSLDDTVELYVSVMDLWRKQRDHLPLAWLEYRYENLVDDMDGTLSAVLNFLNLDWTDDIRAYREHAQTRHIVTPSYRTVGKQLYSRAAGRWKRYETHLSSANQRLASYLQDFGYDQ